MGDVDEHALGSNLFAAHLFFQRIEELVDLHRKCTGLGLSLTLPGRLDAQLGKIVTADSVRQDDVDHSLAQRAIADRQLDMHFGLASELGHADSEGAPVHPDRLTERVVALKDGSEAEG